MSSSRSLKAMMLAEGREHILEHMQLAPEAHIAEDTDFEVWGRKFVELKVRNNNFR
jgi:hypothetical protein